MKQIIDRKVYDTETAIKIASWDNDRFSSDFHYVEETLYVTKKGQHFVAGEGGPATTYARPCGSNSTAGSSEIRLLSPDEALEWCEEKRINPEIVAEFFHSQIKEG